jgi:hypothetical protein
MKKIFKCIIKWIQTDGWVVPVLAILVAISMLAAKPIVNWIEGDVLKADGKVKVAEVTYRICDVKVIDKNNIVLKVFPIEE